MDVCLRRYTRDPAPSCSFRLINPPNSVVRKTRHENEDETQTKLGRETDFREAKDERVGELNEAVVIAPRNVLKNRTGR